MMARSDVRPRVSASSFHFALLIMALWVLLSLVAGLASARAQSSVGPGWIDPPVPMPAQTTQAAPRQARPQAQAGTTSLASAAAIPVPSDPEILELARALRNNPDLIFEYVYNNIETLPIYGSLKGPLGTVLDGKGTAFDQAELMAALLQMSGYNPVLEAGQINLNALQISSWLGTNDSSGFLSVLNAGGIGFTVINSNSFNVNWAWVRVTIDGTSYVFNPADKTYVRQAGIASNLKAMMGYDQNSFLAAARAGSTSTTNSITALNRGNITDFLNSYANSLVTSLKDQYPSASPSDILGGLLIVPRPINDRQRLSNLPNLVSVTGTYPNGFCENPQPPSTLCTLLTVTVPGTQPVYFRSSDVYGRRLSLFFNAALQPVLALDGQARATGTAVASGSSVVTAIDIQHPGTFPPNQGGGLTVTASANGAYIISNGWGGVGRGMVERHRRLLQQNTAALPGNAFAEPVLGESLAVLGYTWLAQGTRMEELLGVVGGTRSLYRHGVGLVGMQASLPPSFKTGPFVDLPFNVSPTVQLGAMLELG